MTEPPAEFWVAIAKFNQQQFYDCHDILEAIWVDAPEADRRFYQGLLQIAVACYHLGQYNLSGAMILLGEGLSRLQTYQPDYYQVQIDPLIEASANLLEGIQALSQAADHPLNPRSPDPTSDWAQRVQALPRPQILSEPKEFLA